MNQRATAFLLIFVLGVVLAFAAGMFWNHKQLNRCQLENKKLVNDLAHAVQRGVTMEANLNLCREQKK